MHTTSPPSLAFEEVDDLLYFTRANEAEDLQQTIQELSQKYECQPRDVLEAAADPNTGNTVLHFCSANGLVDLLKSLLTQLNTGEPNKAADGKTVGSLLFNGQNKEGNTPLHWAAYNGYLEVCKLLVAAGADMWVKNAAGHLAMFEAERAEKNDVVQYLLEAGGRKVEQAGQEGQLGAEDEVEIVEGEASGSNGSAAVGGATGDVNVNE
ncbi:hypothetical protein KC343_g6800 [Hortaea werneckii]|uniref:Uncharacterized protein n=1 Tax=Hortaea werneckii TaxID=91943 RepID=A0A3M7HMK2_HORWE|nr:hypothetical protein KC317_g3862 [Hortaea werneckii]KAI7619790.1 hypothetical protein KC346_g4425 [Hortaea werneckii]KAI7624963.1 hypothetical protein KC343_g6800 [Hortaea werneckii]KAI7680047.1 hypothetical protein KC319_g2400 [Hortaea werneckii]KAI7681535.1 hypothetical protein KC322_g14181 [Hortaea werneckii]